MFFLGNGLLFLYYDMFNDRLAIHDASLTTSTMVNINIYGKHSTLFYTTNFFKCMEITEYANKFQEIMLP